MEVVLIVHQTRCKSEFGFRSKESFQNPDERIHVDAFLNRIVERDDAVHLLASSNDGFITYLSPHYLVGDVGR